MNKNIDQLYKEKFENFEAPVSDGLWNKIQENPTWQQHLRHQKIRNLAIYAGLAVVVIGTCIALILHKPADNTLDTPENGEPISETTVSISETTNTENVTKQEQVTETISENPVQDNTKTPTWAEEIPDDEQIEAGEVPTSPEADLSSASSTDNPVKAENPSDNKTNTENTTTKEKQSAKSGEEQTTESSPIPSPSDNTSSKTSMFSIPNTFTPNGDGLNDMFKPVTAAEITNYQLDIFMMNGQHIFSSKSLEYGWNGEYQGSLVNNGTYIYVIKYKDTAGKEHIDKGQLLLMR